LPRRVPTRSLCVLVCNFAPVYSPVHLHVPSIAVKELCLQCVRIKIARIVTAATCQQGSAPPHLLRAQLPDLPSPSLPAGRVVQGAPVTRDRSMENAKINGFAKVCARNDGTCRNKPPFLEIARVFGHFFLLCINQSPQNKVLPLE
jgi:hypothetical protein